MDIPAWLEGIGLGQYAELFRSNDIDGTLVHQLSSDDLKELGVTSLGHRKKLMAAIAALGGEPGSAPAGAVSPKLVADAAPAAERRQLTVMFVDLVGSTALSTQLDPEDMRELIRAYQNTVAGEISRFEGHIAQFLGDGVLAYFGWPRAHEDDAERAVRAGLAVTAAAARLATPTARHLQTRIGIATGMVVVGDLIGEGSGQRHAVVGETPNFAARLQGVAEPGMVVIAESTRHLAGDLFVLRSLGARTFKGIAEPAGVFAVIGARDVESRFAARHGEVTVIVGRDQELALLVERWRLAKAGEGQVVLLSGEAGVGKSRIVEAVIEAARAEPHFLLRYQCSPYHADSALYPAIQQLAHAAGFTQGDSAEQRLERLEALLATSTDKVDAVAPLVAVLLGLDPASRYSPNTLTPQQSRSRTLSALVDQLTGLASRKPVLWVVEDAHWIDPTTLELIELALDRVQGIRVLTVVTSRPTFVASFGSHPVVTRLALNRLGRAATQAIISRIARGKRLPTVLLDEIAAKTDGVPLFVEEMTKAVIESGELREDGEAFHLEGPLSALAIPTTLHDSLMARLDRLQPVKEVAQTAAVIGRSFDHRTIAALSDKPPDELASALRQLVEAELIFRRGEPPEATYLFKHALVRDAAYESLLKTKRISLHTRLLDVLEAWGDEAAELKAQHAEAAGLTERALDHWEQAGAQALARPAYKEAIAHLEHAVRLCHAMGEAPQWKRREIGLWLQQGQALIASQGYQSLASLHAFDQARRLADEIGDAALQLPAVYGQWVHPYLKGMGSVELAKRYSELAETQGDRGLRLVGFRMLGLERYHEGRFKESLGLISKSLDLYDPVAHRDLAHRFGHDPRTAATNYKSWILWRGFADQAARTSDDGLRWTRHVNHANTTGFALCYGVNLLNVWLRQPAKVESAAREALLLSEENSMALWHAFAQIFLGWALSHGGRASGLEEIEAGLGELRDIGARRLEPLQFAIAADAYSRVGRHDEAMASMAKAFAGLEHGHDMALAAELYRSRAALLSHAGARERDAVEADLRRALEIANEQEALSLQLRAARDLAALWAERGERRRAADLLVPIYGAFTEGFGTPDLVESRALLDDLRN
ncbi:MULTISPECIES: AAA family ATPase [Ramlibacter]|uniref:AAA family ATPase n=1 Tax=Ramlibacter pinisoli TaxID=2682844 RepID=A0A6N8IRF2_9BURK|nr:MULTISPECIES: adenylate/guanylate cyclase domain-containing protein [Ramlibacter]MBA2964462.1 AAA family ATPase [Ramlibacter sp. CGMCC 1.13660]MVQ29428.1 AAA family ATPase [Ramlibacter pinisoli]